MSKSKRSDQNEQLKALCDNFKVGIGPFVPVGAIEAFHAQFTLTENIKVTSEAIIEKIKELSDSFVKSKDNSGYFKSNKPDCEVYIKQHGENIELKMVSLVSEECETVEEMKLLGEECKESFMKAIEAVHQANS